MKKVVIIGGGFAGGHCARRLERNKNFEVTLIDTKDHFEFTPGILRTIVDLDYEKKIQSLHKEYLKKTKIIFGQVEKILKNSVKIGNKKIPFDYLIITAGSEYASPIKGKNVILPNRMKILEEANFKLKKAKKILVVGGGLVGVELVGEIVEKCPEKKITLIHSRDSLIPRNSPKAREYCSKFLQDQGVEIILNQKARDLKKYDLIFFCTGIRPHLDFVQKEITDERGLIVNKFLQVKNSKNIFAGGDITNILEEKTAQNAEEHAKIIVRNIFGLEKNKELSEYISKPRIIVISLGKYNGILEYKNFTLTGKIPAILKWLIERKTMRDYR